MSRADIVSEKLDKAMDEGPAEDAIRAAFNKESRTIGKWHPITVKVGPVTRNFMAKVDKVQTKGNSVLRLIHIKLGKLFKDDDPEPITTTYKLDTKNKLTEIGLPNYSNKEELSLWKKAGFKVEKL